jgi:hypothetical protein
MRSNDKGKQVWLASNMNNNRPEYVTSKRCDRKQQKEKNIKSLVYAVDAMVVSCLFKQSTDEVDTSRRTDKEKVPTLFLQYSMLPRQTRKGQVSAP